MITTDNISDIIKEIKRIKSTVIAIDGIDGSGKSTLSKELSKLLKMVHINLDDYLDKNRGGYINFIDYASLKECIKQACDLILIDGIILSTLKTINTDKGKWHFEKISILSEPKNGGWP